MKIKIWPDDTTVVEMDDWLAELRDDGRTAPPVAPPMGPSPATTEPAAPDGPAASAAGPAASAAGPAALVAGPAALAESVGPADATVRPLIGDQLRMPISWCEMGSCISWHADPAALGEGDQRARAIEAGWRIDAFGRLACPRCLQTDPGFRATHPVVPWNRFTAMARAARFAADRGDARTADEPATSR